MRADAAKLVIESAPVFSRKLHYLQAEIAMPAEKLDKFSHAE